MNTLQLAALVWFILFIVLLKHGWTKHRKDPVRPRFYMLLYAAAVTAILWLIPLAVLGAVAGLAGYALGIISAFWFTACF